MEHQHFMITCMVTLNSFLSFLVVWTFSVLSHNEIKKWLFSTVNWSNMIFFLTLSRMIFFNKLASVLRVMFVQSEVLP